MSSKDQEREGFSIPAQLRFLRQYGQTQELNVLHEFADVETAKTTGRKQFGEMVRFLPLAQTGANIQQIVYGTP